MGQSSARTAILHRSEAQVNTVNYQFLPNASPAREWNRVEQGAEGQLTLSGHFTQNPLRRVNK